MAIIIPPTTVLSANFKLSEFLRSSTAERQDNLLQAQYNPPSDVVANLTYLVATTLQPLREEFYYPIIINSGYRSPELNTAVGGSKTSQHLIGQAADCSISDRFLRDPRYTALRARIEDRILARTGSPLRKDVNANFYLYAYLCLRLEHYDIDQLIHEYGPGYGRPAWIHISSSPGTRNKRQPLIIGGYHKGKKQSVDVETALRCGT